ncbi:hypothetical protein Cgig2_004384 [Carnegiea gigantea]|uniref:MADS-box domain-containing protein n=1 Tax=Carnegiea gigantea TaxID=171969 RepID=A0A9Q1JRP3_9CARY|nr:hypothetical protein Cgig2_004384 [Carnegiea gigantea]
MARIKNPSHRQVTFSKRRLGLFKKASEICTLCGVEAVIIVFSPGQKIFSFGHPDVESLVDRFLSRNPCPQTPSSSNNSLNNKLKGVQQAGSCIRELNSQLTQILDLLDAEKSRGEVLDNMRRSCTQQSQWWWEAPIDKLGLHELEVLSASMEDLKKNIANQAIYLERNNSASSSILGMDINGGVGVSQHFDLKSIEAKVQGFCQQLPLPVDNFHAQKFF